MGCLFTVVLPFGRSVEQSTGRAVHPGPQADAAPVTGGSTNPAPSTVNGAPAGFQHTQEGAVAAAAAFVCTGQALIDMDPLAAEEAIREMAAASTADIQVRAQLDQLDRARQALAKGTGPIVFRQSAVAWRVDSYTTELAQVSIWSVSVLSRDGIAPPQASWSTSTFELVWEREGWRISNETITPGPAPLLDNSSAPATSEQLARQLDGFTDFGSIR